MGEGPKPAASDPAEILEYLWSGYPDGRLAFEVGANQGQSIPYMSFHWDRVVAFEPWQPNFEVITSLPPNAEVRMVAVSDRDGEVTLVDVEDQLRTRAHEAAKRLNFDDYGQIVVPCVTLDSVMAEVGCPDFVNMDIEGSELDALHGAAKLLTERRTSWLIEFHSQDLHDDCEALLMALRYEVETVRHPHYPLQSENWFAHGWLKVHPRGLL
jgi:FkbM family methyltransferase